MNLRLGITLSPSIIFPPGIDYAQQIKFDQVELKILHCTLSSCSLSTSAGPTLATKDQFTIVEETSTFIQR
jgi:hypothetical protein